MNDIIRLSVSEAARLFGIHEQTIRRAIKNQEVVYAVVRGRYQLNFESLLKWSQIKPQIKNKLEEKGIGQFVNHWKIKNPLFSPNPEALKKAPLDKMNKPSSLPINSGEIKPLL